MSREPIAVYLLSIPFNFAIFLTKTSVKVLSILLSRFIEVFIVLLQALHFRRSFIEWSISGILKTGLIASTIFAYIWLWILAVYLLWHQDLPALSLAFTVLEIIVTIYLIKKSSSLVESRTKAQVQDLIVSGLKDFVSFVFTMIAVFSVLGIFHMNGVPKTADAYFEFILKVIQEELIDLAKCPFHIILFIFPWRYYLYIKDKSNLSLGDTVMLALYHFFQGIIDLPFLLMLLIQLFSVLQSQKAFRLIKQQKISREAIFKGFVRLILLIVSFVLTIGIIGCLVRAKALFVTFGIDKRNKNKTEMDYFYEICNHALDTLLFPLVVFEALLVIIPFYRLRQLDFNLSNFLSKSDSYRKTASDIFEELKNELKDLSCLYLYMITLPFFWRSIPFIFKKKQESWRTEVCYLARNCVLDIAGSFLFLIILVTLYRIRLISKRRKTYKNDHFFFLMKAVVWEIYEDALISPYILIMILTPWRLLYTFSFIFGISNLKKQRQHIKDNGFRPIEDYLTLIFSIILFLSVWRTAEIASIIITHIRQVWHEEQVTSSLFRKVFRKFVQLLIDVMMFFIICLIFLMLIEIPNLFRRIKMFCLLYKDRRGIILFSYIKSLLPKPKNQVVKKSVVDKLNKNVFFNVSTFLDIESLGNVAQANKKLHDLASFAPVWKNQYEAYWRPHLPESSVKEIEWEDNYKRLAVEGFLNYKEQNRMVNLSEQERDYRMGARAIILEEFVMSLFRFPHLLVLPLKMTTYLLLKMDYKAYFANPRYPSLQYKLYMGYNASTDYVSSRIIANFEPNVQNSTTFHKIQLNFPYAASMLLLIIVEHAAFIVCTIDFWLLKALSFGSEIPLQGLVMNTNPPKYKFLVFLLQLVFTIIAVPTKIFIVFSPYLLAWHFRPDFYELWYPCYNLSFAFIIAVIWTNIATIAVYMPHFPYFRPHLTFKYLVFFFIRIIAKFFKVFEILYRIIKPSGKIFRAYKKILEASGSFLKNWGLFGDLIYSPLVFIWIFWPITIPYYFNNWNYLIPAIPATVFLLIKGYSTAKNTWTDNSKKNN